MDDTTPPTFHVKETDLAASLGIPRIKLKQLRDAKLTRGADWSQADPRFPKSSILYSTAGVQRVRAEFGVETDAERDARVAVADSIQRDEATLVVTRTDWANKNLVQGKLPTGELVRIRVRRQAHSKIIKHMKLPCRQVAGDVWECVRHPRYRGRL